MVIIVFVLGFFLYMFYPSGGAPGHGYHPDKGFVHPEASKAEDSGSKFKRLFKRKKKAPQTTTDFAKSMTAAVDDRHYETFHYSEGYKKERSYGYDYSTGGVKGLLQKLKRKKPEAGPQMHLDQFSKPDVAKQDEESSGSSAPSS